MTNLYLPQNLRSPQAPPELVSRVEDLRRQTAEAARFDPGTFNAFVLKDEQTGRPVKMQPMHREWHQLISRHQRTLIWAHVEAGKTQQISIGRVLFELGRNRNLRIAIISNTGGQAAKTVMAIARYIEQDQELHEVFPDLKPDKTGYWNQSQLTVQGRKGAPRSPSVQALGIHANILGDRIDLLIIDDLLDYESALSMHQREELLKWFNATLEGRLTKDARVVCVGTAWHRDDIMHHWARMQRYWTAVRYPVMNSRGQLTWPERWPLGRIEDKRGVLGPVEYARQLMCTARNDESSRFQSDWIELCRSRGRRHPRSGLLMPAFLQFVPAGVKVFTGVDLSTGKNKHSGDLSCLFTIAVMPNEDREILDVQAGRWTGPEIVRRINDTHHRFHSIFIVESNGAQEFILQFQRKESAVPVLPFNTGKNKLNPEHGIESIAVELANGKWIIPTDATTGRSMPEVESWIQEMLGYDPKAHTGDRLMASWFAREGARMKPPKARVGRLDTLSR